jgi:hypothetical protein
VTCPRRAKLILTKDHLIVANTGTAFTRRGLDSIVYGWMSSKDDDAYISKEVDEPFDSSGEAQAFMKEIVFGESGKRAKFSNPKELDAARRALAQISQDYRHARGRGIKVIYIGGAGLRYRPARLPERKRLASS